MAIKKILNVKQAAKILGVSTNTMYKYLNQGTITAARGHGQASFRIPLTSLEFFLGSKIPEEALAALENTAKRNTPEVKSSKHLGGDGAVPAATPIQTESPPKTLATKTIRVLLLVGLALTIIDTVTSKQFNFGSQLTRIAVFAILTLLAYQQGGFLKK